MELRKLIKKGSEHKVFCQDFIYADKINNIIAAGVFDGCSQVEDSQFASNLFGKIFRQNLEILKNSGLILIDVEKIALTQIYCFFKSVAKIKKELSLINNDLMSTAIFLFYNENYKEGIIYSFGDGYVKFGDTVVEIDQDNHPHYPISYIDNLCNTLDECINFLHSYKNKWKFSDTEDIVISTDGILSFENRFNYEIPISEAIDFLVKDQEMSHLSKMLGRKYNILQSNGWHHKDDLGIVRLLKVKEKIVDEPISNELTYST